MISWIHSQLSTYNLPTVCFMLERNKPECDIYDLSKMFALRIVRLYKFLKDVQTEYIISTQILRSGTSIGANIHEAKNAQSRADFCSKMNIALKEASETGYWLDLLMDAEYVTQEQYDSLVADYQHIEAVLTKIVKATKPK